MEKPVIGIRQADGSFYVIMDESLAGRKRLVLSAARTDQRGVKIDLFRSTDGSLDSATPLGTIALDDPEGLGYKDIEFRVDIGDDALLDASAALPGQPPQTLSIDLSPFQGPRSDAAVLADENLGADLDTLDDSFLTDPVPEDEPETMTLDLPEVEEPDAEEPRRSDADILNDDQFASADLDTLDLGDLPDLDLGAAEPEAAPEGPSDEIGELADLPDLDLGAEPAAEPSDTESFDLGDLGSEPADEDHDLDLADLGAPGGTSEADSLELGDLDTLDDFSIAEEATDTSAEEPDLAADSFDMGDLDAGFGEAEPAAEKADSGEPWEKVDFDEMESMEFMDTGDEISNPTSVPTKAAPAKAASDPDDFSMDDDVPLELNDLDTDFGDLPDLDSLGQNKPSSAEDSGESNDFDMDFLPPPALTETPAWDEKPAAKAKGEKKSKVKEPKAPKHREEERAVPEGGSGGLDKTALFLSLAALSLLVLLILVLLFLNMIKAPPTPVIQPEVMGWDKTATVATAQRSPSEVDLGAESPVTFEASSVLEVPEGLRHAKVTLKLEPGETPADAARRFGPPARVQGNVLSW